MSAFLALVLTDIRLFLADRRAVVMALVAPIAIAAFFGGLFTDRESPQVNARLVITDSDDSALTRAVLAALRQEPTLTVSQADEGTGRAAVTEGRQDAWLHLPSGFGEAAALALRGPGPKPTVQLWVDPAQARLRPMLEGLTTQRIMQALMAPPPGDSGSAGAEGAGGKPGAAGAPATAEASTRSLLPFALHTEATASHGGVAEGYDGYAHSFAGMGAQFILMFGVDVGIGLLTLRGQGLWQRLRVAPVGKATLIGSRIASCALIATAIFAIVMAAGVVGFGVRVQGSVLGLVLILVAYACFTAAFGMAVAAFGRTPEAARGLAILLTLLLVMVGGAWVPSFIFPPWLQTVSSWTPIHWAVSGLDAMTWRGQPLAAAMTPVAVLMGFALALGALAIARFDRNA